MFCRWKSTDNNDINIFMSLENATFLLAKEKTWKHIFNTNSELSQNRTEKQIMPFKITVNWLFNDIWCYLVIRCFNWKIGIFQQTVLRGLLYLKYVLWSLSCNYKFLVVKSIFLFYILVKNSKNRYFHLAFEGIFSSQLSFNEDWKGDTRL